MSAFVLKLLALLTMVIDHTAAVLGGSSGFNVLSYETYDLMRMVGRVAFPIYAFLLVQGFRHTHNVRRYALRLLGLGLLSQIPYAFTINGWVLEDPVFAYKAFTNLNILFTLLFGLLMLCFFHTSAPARYLRSWPGAAGLLVFSAMLYASTWYTPALLCAAAAVLLLIAKKWEACAAAGDQMARLAIIFALYGFVRRYTPIDFDYALYGLAIIAALYWAGKNWRCAIVIAVWGVIVYSGFWHQVGAVLVSAAAVAFYNGKRGPNDHRLFYWAYPAHLCALWGVAALLR